EEYETLVLREHRLVILALRVDPEFEHPARAMEGAGNAAFTIELANVAQVDEYHVGAAVHRHGGIGRQRLDLALGRRDQRLDMGGDVLRHRARSGCGAMWAERSGAVKPGGASLPSSGGGGSIGFSHAAAVYPARSHRLGNLCGRLDWLCDRGRMDLAWRSRPQRPH